jgi:hypothetical protein
MHASHYGEIARACLTLAVQADGCTIETSGSLADEKGELSDLRKGLQKASRSAMWLLHTRNTDVIDRILERKSSPHRRRDPRYVVWTFVSMYRLRGNGKGVA